MKKHLSKILLTLLAFSFTSCAADPNFRAYVIAHRANHDVTAVQYGNYITNDPTLSEMHKTTYLRRLQVEEEMISGAEKLLGIK